ncbi:MAG: methyltransferase family protein [Actinomycetota bacterium]
MKILTDWGFSREGLLTGKRGEYLVIIQAALILGFILLPIYQLPGFKIELPAFVYLSWGVAGLLGLWGAFLLLKGLLDLGKNLTPLPYPREDGELVQTGVYSLVRHPLYSGLIFVALGWSIFCFSFSHLVMTMLLLIFFDIKGRREETWLTEKYSDYSEYQHRVKKLIPWIY